MHDENSEALYYYNNVDGNLIITITRVYESFVNTVFVYFMIARVENCATMH